MKELDSSAKSAIKSWKFFQFPNSIYSLQLGTRPYHLVETDIAQKKKNDRRSLIIHCSK